MSEFPIPEASAARPNLPEFTVTELSSAVKKTVEGAFGYVRVRGEISRPTTPGSGHCYLRLKDEMAVLEAVIWKGTLARLGLRPEDGMEVICTGRLTTYPGKSTYQLIIERMELAGEGALLKMIEERRKRLAAEGLFDEARKKPLPYLPVVIGVVTSPTASRAASSSGRSVSRVRPAPPRSPPRSAASMPWRKAVCFPAPMS
jgi:exodeoxyribonuclease VII large subunit